MSEAQKNRSEETLAKMSAAQTTSKKIEVIDLQLDTKTIYPSISSAAKALNVRQPSISDYLAHNRQVPFKGRDFFVPVSQKNRLRAFTA